ncbi:MAG: TonB-dependent receptor [Chitinophagaceae bacterium]|nr:TonB-dependent receptor [Chitinophagaceae bacterium]
MKQFLNSAGLVIVFVCINIMSMAQGTGRISGTVVDKATQKPLSSVSVTLTGGRGTITDSNGVFRITGIELKTYNIDFSLVRYKPQTLFNIVINAGNENNYTIEMEPNAASLSEVVVKANKRTVRAATLETPLSVQRLTTEEIKSNPGGNFDISKVIQTLPGVGGGQGGGGFRNDIIIRGGAPNENVFYLDGIEIPVINHFQTQGSAGGPQGILNVSFIEDVKLSSSAFDARYDNAMSSVFQFKQKNGNPNKLQGNFRLSATEVAATLEGPLSKNKKTTFLASVRRSYLELLFSAIDLPIRPNYWDFQTKITHQINKKTTLSFIGIGAIDEFKFAPVKNATPEKLYVLNSNPIINQWNYTFGISLKRLVQNGFVNMALSRNSFENDIEQYEDNQLQLPSQRTLLYKSNETENKFRIDVNKNKNGWKIAYGAMVQLADFTNNTFSVIRKEIKDSNGAVVQPPVIINFKSPLNNFRKMGAFAQVSKRFFDNRLGLSAGLRTDMNTFTTDGMNALQTLSPRISFSYVLADKWTANASVGRYFKIPPYTILGFADNNNVLVNKNSKYLASNHYTAGVEYLPNDNLRFTAEGFYKHYDNVPVSVRDGISLSNLGSDFNVLGNEAVATNGKGRAYGFEFFAQKKLTKRFFGILSYTFYRSEYSGANQIFLPSSWDNRQLLSITWGYKFPRNWELGLKFRYQGGAPFTPFDEAASRINYLSRGQGVLDFARLNSVRLNGFNSSDVRIDKKWNFKKTTIDLFLDVTNWYGAKNAASPSYTFKRNAANTAFLTTNGLALKQDGSNAIPLLLKNEDVSITPTIGLIVEF